MQEKHKWETLFIAKWNGINTRTKYDPYYKDRISNEFKDYQAFRTFCVENYHASGCVIDRIHASGNYCAQNCQFLSIQDHRIKTAKETRMFTDASIKSMRKDYWNGCHINELAEAYGCSSRHIYRIVKYESYRDVI